MDSPPRGFVHNRVAKTVVLVVACLAAFLIAIPPTQSRHVFRSESVVEQALEFPVGSPAGMMTGFASRSVTFAVLVGWTGYFVAAIAVVRSQRLGVVIGGLIVLVAMLVFNVLSVWVVAGLSGLR